MPGQAGLKTVVWGYLQQAYGSAGGSFVHDYTRRNVRRQFSRPANQIALWL